MFGETAFALVRKVLGARIGQWDGGPFFVPGHLVGRHARDLVDVQDPYQFFTILLRDLAEHPRKRNYGKPHAVYWWHSRSHATLNGRPGTALAQIAFLSHLAQLGFSDIVLLPTAKVGDTHRRSASGSPFAVSNPFRLDPALTDPLLGDAVSGIDQYRAFVYACHLAGLRVSSIVPLATFSIDSPLFQLFPKIGFWWKAEPGTLLLPEEMGALGSQATVSPATVSPPIGDWARRKFFPAPDNAQLKAGPHGQLFLVSTTPTGEGLTLANAIPDIVAGDPSAYTWLDSSAVNFDGSLIPAPMGIVPEHRALDDVAVAIVALTLAFRWAELGEDGAVVDVAPNVPLQVIDTAETIAANWTPTLSNLVQRPLAEADPSALLSAVHATLNGTTSISSHWLMAEELWSFDGAADRFDAVTGPLPYSVGAYSHDPESCISMLERHISALCALEANPQFSAAAALHDTLPPFPIIFLLLTAAVSVLPGAIPTIFSGLEHGSTHLTNGEFGFSGYQAMLDYRRWVGLDGLALFNAWPFDWTSADPAVYETLSATLRSVLRVQNAIKPERVQSVNRLTPRALGFTVQGTRGTARVVLNLDTRTWVSETSKHLGEIWSVIGKTFSGGEIRPTFAYAALGQTDRFEGLYGAVPPLCVRVTTTNYPGDDSEATWA